MCHIHLNRTKSQLLVVAALSLLCSCGKGEKTAAADNAELSADSMAVVCYTLQAQGHFSEYVNTMQSAKDMPDDYKQRTVDMLRQHQAYINKEKQGVKSVTALRSELHNGGKMANVFLSVTYNDNSREEILFPMVHDGKQWRPQ